MGSLGLPEVETETVYAVSRQIQLSGLFFVFIIMYEISPYFYFDNDNDDCLPEFAFIFPRPDRRHRVSVLVILDKYVEDDICNVDIGLAESILGCTRDELDIVLKTRNQCFRFIRVYHEVLNTRNLNYPYLYEDIAWALELPLDDKERRHIEHRLAQEFTFIYVIKDLTSGYYKIGQSKHPEDRLKTLKREPTLLPYPLDFHMVRVWRDYPWKERDLHKQFADKRIRGEWFDLTATDLDAIEVGLI